MVKVQRDRDICVGNSRIDKLDKIDMLGIFARAGGNLEDNGRLQFGSRLCDPWTISMLLTLNAPTA